MKIKHLFFQLLLLFLSCFTFGQNNTRPNVFLPAVTNMQVNSYAGSLFHERSDLFIPARGIDLDFTFSYNSSLDTTNWGYGYGWTHAYNMNYLQKVDTFTFVKSDGRRDVFVKNGSNFIAPTGVFDLLQEYEPGKLRLTTKNGMKYFFENNSHKHLTKTQDRNGNAITMSYAGSQLTAVTDAAGRQISLTWQNGRLTGIVDNLGTPVRTWTYTYDNDGNLSQVTNPLNGQVSYVYEGHRLVRMTDENASETIVGYFESGGVEFVATCLSRHTFSYQLNEGKTIVTEIVGNGSQTTTYEFDSMGRNIARQGNCCGFEVSFVYDASNNITSTTDANGDATTFSFDGQGNATEILDAEGCEIAMAYEPQFNQNTSFTDKNGNTITFTYDSNGKLTSIQRPLGVTESYAYDAFGNQTSYTDGNGNTTTYVYNANGYLTQINHPVGNYTTQFTYDNRGNKLTEINANGKTTLYTYDLLNRLTQAQDPLGNTTTYEYDARGNRTEETNAIGNATQYFYDPLERLVKIQAPLNFVTQYVYDSRGNLISETDPRGNTVQYAYDDRNFLVSQTDQLGNVMTYAYDGNGNQTSVTDANGNTTQYSYDDLGRLTTTQDPMGLQTTYSYDCNGNILSVTDANGNAVSYAYDALNRQISMTDALNYNTQFAYDDNNNLTQITDAKGNPTSYAYDALNRKTVETYADNTTKIFTYDGVGNVASRKDNAGNMTFYTYDDNNRLTLRNYSDTNDDHFLYDALGRMSSAINNHATVTFTYDALNRMLSETLNGKTTGYAYNNTTGKRTLLYPSGRVIEEYYDARNQLASIKESNDVLASFAYDPAGRMTVRNYGNGTTTAYSYDNNNRVTSILANPGAFIHFNYAYDNVGNKLYEEKLHHPTHSEAYGYDDNYRLTSFKVGTLAGGQVPAPNTQTAYNYDGLGNRTTVVEDGVVTMYEVNEMNEYEVVNGQSLVYDLNGNLISEPGITYQYDFENRIANSITPGTMIFYQYDAKERMIKEIRNTDETSYHFSESSAIQKDVENNVTTYVSNKIDDIISYSTGQIFYLYQGTNLSTVAILDGNAITEERYEYDRFGNVAFYSGNFGVLSQSILDNDILFTGRNWETDIQKYYFRMRYYSPQIGGYLERDPLGFVDGYNLYNSYFVTIGMDPFGTNAVPSASRCNSLMDAYYKTFGNNLNHSKCEKPKIMCSCNCRKGLKGEYYGNTPENFGFGGTINVCLNNTTNLTDFQNTMMHELQHYSDDCNKNCPFKTEAECDACTEVKAYKRECKLKYSSDLGAVRECVRDGANKSCKGKKCKKSVNSIFEKCFGEKDFMGN